MIKALILGFPGVDARGAVFTGTLPVLSVAGVIG
jgi:hypothetical protein